MQIPNSDVKIKGISIKQIEVGKYLQCPACVFSDEKLTLGRLRGGYHPLAFFPYNFFDDSNRENRLVVSVTRDGRHIFTYVTPS